MRFHKLDLNLLVALDAMLGERNITRAAERLHMSQSAMSNALGRLREYFDDELLVPVGRRMELTPRAEVLRDEVHDLLLRLNTTLAARPEFVPSASDREFRIFVSDYTMVTLIPHVLARAHAEGSRVRFALQAQVDEPGRALERGEVDLLVLPSNFCSPEHPLETLFTEHFVCVMWKDSRLAQGGFDVERYAAARHVVMQPSGVQAASFETGFMQRHGVKREVEVSTYSFAAAPYLVVGTELVATVHSRLARQALRCLPLVLREPPLPLPLMSQSIQWHKYRTKDPGIAWLRRMFHEAAREMDAGLAPA
jgi:LysR family transcriptional regulator, nod-box dependent transcriptional activator